MMLAKQITRYFLLLRCCEPTFLPINMQERDMRERVQKKRAFALERARREDMVMRLHEDRKIRQEVIGPRLKNAVDAIQFPR